MTAPRKPARKKSADRAALDAGLSIPPPPPSDGNAAGKASAKASAAAEALKRLSKMTPEEQAAALFESMRASSSRKDR